MSKHVYLAGPMTGANAEEERRWRRLATKMFEAHGIHTRSPYRGKPCNGKHCLCEWTQPSGVLLRDRHDVKTAAAVLMNLLNEDLPSRGSMVEVGWANAYDVPLVIVTASVQVTQHPILRHAAMAMVKTLGHGIDAVLTVLGADYHVGS